MKCTVRLSRDASVDSVQTPLTPSRRLFRKIERDQDASDNRLAMISKYYHYLRKSCLPAVNTDLSRPGIDIDDELDLADGRLGSRAALGLPVIDSSST